MNWKKMDKVALNVAVVLAFFLLVYLAYHILLEVFY